MNLQTLLQLFVLFSSLSILSIGGGNTVLPEMHRKAVTVDHWLTDGEFADVFAISQTAPGPSILIVTLIGYKAAGVVGAIVATIAMILPAAVLVFLLARVWERAKDSALRAAVEKGFAPLTVGLILASGWVMTRAADHDWRAWLLTAVCTVIFIRTKWSPLTLVALASLLGWLGWV